MSKAVRIVKDPEQEIPVEVMEKAIMEIAEGFKRLNASRLSKRAIILLVQDAVGVTAITKSQVEAVLDAAQNLGKRYLKP